MSNEQEEIKAMARVIAEPSPPPSAPARRRPMFDYHGHVTLADGSHVPLTKETAEALWRASEESKRRRKELIPTEQAALQMLCQAYQRLKDFGWREAMYCPKDGTPFNVIEAGSTGVHDCHYSGEWPSGSFWISDAGDLWPSNPLLFKLRPEDEAKQKAKMAEAAERFRQERDAAPPAQEPPR